MPGGASRRAPRQDGPPGSLPSTTLGLGLNMLIAWLLERAGVHWLLISLTVLIIVPMFNFAGHRLITFARSG